MSEPASELITLTQAEEDFCLGVIEYGGNIAAAYREAFGDSISNPGARGKRLLSRPDIALRIKKLADATQEHSFISLGSHYMQLARLRDLAVDQGDIKSAIVAEVKRGELANFYKKDSVDPNEKGKSYVQINFNGPMTGAASPADWAAKFGNPQPILIENEDSSH